MSVPVLQSVLQRGVFMDPQSPDCCNTLWVLATAKELCSALAYLHAMDVVHGDLKSSNVLLKAAATTAWDTRGFVAKVCGSSTCAMSHQLSSHNTLLHSVYATCLWLQSSCNAALSVKDAEQLTRCTLYACANMHPYSLDWEMAPQPFAHVSGIYSCQQQSEPVADLHAQSLFIAATLQALMASN